MVDPRRRARRRFLGWLLGFAVLFLALAAFVVRPAPVLGVDGEVLGHSVGGFLEGATCEGAGDGSWDCRQKDGLMFSNGAFDYRVEVDDLGCWRAEPQGAISAPDAKPASGCLTLVNFILG